MDKLLHNFRENIFNFVLKCREKNQLPISVQEEIVNDVNFLLCFFKDNYDDVIDYHLQKNGFDIAECPDLAKVMHSNDFFDVASRAIRSPYLIKEHCKSRLNMIEPVHYKLRNTEGHAVGSYSYVPIAEVLKNYLSHEDIRDQILSEDNVETDREYIRNYTDGQNFQNHQFLNFIQMHYVFICMRMNLK